MIAFRLVSFIMSMGMHMRGSPRTIFLMLMLPE